MPEDFKAFNKIKIDRQGFNKYVHLQWKSSVSSVCFCWGPLLESFADCDNMLRRPGTQLIDEIPPNLPRDEGLQLIIFSSLAFVHFWTWLSWRGKSKLPNEDPLEHCVKQKATIGRFPSVPLQRGVTACRACAAIQHAVAAPVPLHIPRFQVWGSNPSQGNFFAFFPSPNFLQRSINGEYVLNNFIHWLGFEPQTWKRGICSGTGTDTARCRGREGKRPMTAYCFTVVQWVFIRQLALWASR